MVLKFERLCSQKRNMKTSNLIITTETSNVDDLKTFKGRILSCHFYNKCAMTTTGIEDLYIRSHMLLRYKNITNGKNRLRKSCNSTSLRNLVNDKWITFKIRKPVCFLPIWIYLRYYQFWIVTSVALLFWKTEDYSKLNRPY